MRAHSVESTTMHNEIRNNLKDVNKRVLNKSVYIQSEEYKKTLMKQKFDVSFILLLYNSEYKKAVLSIESILMQKEISKEIIICDDGSDNNVIDKLSYYLNKKQFDSYKIFKNVDNKGTVCNLYKGINLSEGKYIKALSPGDCIIKQTSILNWIKAMEKENVKWSFSNFVSYSFINDRIKVMSNCKHPTITTPYKRGDINKTKWNYAVLGDVALGAAIICETNLMKKYIEKILWKVKYGEDNIYRMMVIDEIYGYFYDENCILYEIGTGISTSKEKAWRKKLIQDMIKTNELLLISLTEDKYIAGLTTVNKCGGNVIKCIFKLRGYLILIVKQLLFRKKSVNNEFNDLEDINKVLNEVI